MSMSEPVVVDGLTLHPELQFLLDWRASRDAPPLTTLSIAEIRAVMLRDSLVAAGEPAPVDSVSDLVVDGAVGPLRARFYAPPAPWSSLLLFFHGGGFVFGDVDSHDGVCRLLCSEGGFAVLSVEYRLAPEDPFPACVDDAWATWQWVVANGASLPFAPASLRIGVGGDSALPGAPFGLSIGVGGDSAGGLLSAAVCQLAVRAGIPAPALQLLIYPAVTRDRATRSMELFAEGFFLTRVEIDFFESCLLRGVDDDPADFRGHPLVGELSGLAPAIVVTGGFDPLRDGGEAYAAALAAAGTPALLRRYDSLIHGFMNMIGVSPACRAATVEIAHDTAALFAAQHRASP
jgi:acetyl esterase